MKSFISLEEAIEILNEKVNQLSIKEVELLDGIGHRMGETIYSPMSHPPFDKSAMDGYAVRAEETKQGEVRLKIIDEVYAGHVSHSEVTSKTAIRIMTGAKIPEGANAVIKQEEVTVEDGCLVFNKQLRGSENICFKGEDIEVGQLLVPKDKLLDYADIGILASAGISRIKVYQKPRVAFISTGDEVLDLGQALEPGKIYNSNKYAIIGRVKELGYDVAYLNHEQDSIKGIANKLKEASKLADVVITTGGASVGEKDLIKLVFNKQLRGSENICFKGEDIEVGQLLVPKDKLLDYADIGILASAGISRIKVYQKPRVAFISTGDEVLDLGQALEPGKIYNSNKYAIIGRVKELGYDVAYLNHEQDSIKGIANKLKEASKLADVVITTGGASVGEKDLIKEAIDELGGTKLFWKILIKPGSAVLVSEYEGTKIISLSGNPTAALTTFELMARPVLEKLSGKNQLEIKREMAILKTEFTKKSPQRRFVRGYTEIVDETQVVSVTQVKSGNGILSSALLSNCLIEVEANEGPLKVGTLVKIIKL